MHSVLQSFRQTLRSNLYCHQHQRPSRHFQSKTSSQRYQHHTTERILTTLISIPFFLSNSMKTFLFWICILSVVTARRNVPTFPMNPKPVLSPYGPTKLGTWGLPKEDKKEMKEVKRTINKKSTAAKDTDEKHCGPFGVHSVHELEDVMGLE